MKFVSRATNLLIILKPSLSAVPLAGKLAEPGLSVRFEEGIAVVDRDDICEMMMQHRDFNRDFFIYQDGKDPFVNQRGLKEPAHQITELKFGTPVKSFGDKVVQPLTPEMRTFINDSIKNGIQEGMKKLIPDLLQHLKGAAEVVKRKPGRPPKEKEESAKEENGVEQEATVATKNEEVIE